MSYQGPKINNKKFKILGFSARFIKQYLIAYRHALKVCTLYSKYLFTCYRVLVRIGIFQNSDKSLSQVQAKQISNGSKSM